MQFIIQVVTVPKKRCFCSYRCIDIFVVKMIIQKTNLLFLKTFFIETISPLNLSGKIKNNVSVVGVGIFKTDIGGYVYNLFM